MIAAGFLTEILSKRRRIRYYGTMLMGLGLLFFGMELMSEAALPLRTYPPFIELMQDMRNPLIGIMVGALFTALVQSSSATTGIVIVLATQGLVSLEAGVALVLGANVGTCVTAMLSAIGKPRDAVKAAVVHVAFNLIGALLMAALIPQFVELIRAISPAASMLTGTERLAAEVPRQIANAHTLFNVANLALFIGFVGTFAALAERIVSRPTATTIDRGDPLYLEDMFLDQPTSGLDQVKLELDHMGELTLESTKRALPVTLSGDEKALEILEKSDDAIDHLHEEILIYLGKLSLHDLVEPQPRRIQEYIGIANYLENLGDVIETSFVPSGYKRLRQGEAIDQDSCLLLEPLNLAATEALSAALGAFSEDDPVQARAVVDLKEQFDRDAEAVRLRMARRLTTDGREGLSTYRVTVEQVENLKRVHTLARRMARLVIDAWEDINSPREPEARLAPEISATSAQGGASV